VCVRVGLTSTAGGAAGAIMLLVIVLLTNCGRCIDATTVGPVAHAEGSELRRERERGREEEQGKETKMERKANRTYRQWPTGSQHTPYRSH
jgi:hypothetical protein